MGTCHARKVHRHRPSCYNCLCHRMGWKCICRDIDHDRYHIAGELVIVGRVRRPREPSVEIKISPSKTVQVESSSTGGFRWIGPEFPSTCIVEITSGEDKREVVIEKCGLPGPLGPRRSSGTSGPDGAGRTQGRPRRKPLTNTTAERPHPRHS